MQALEVTDDIHNEQQDFLDSSPLDLRVLEAVKGVPDHKIKPAVLASRLGISIEDASAELCGLLRAVGSSATFSFESIDVPGGTTTTMVFHFPIDFEQKAQSSRKKEDIKQVLSNIFYLAVKILKVVVAFGLIISLAILLLAGICCTVAAIIGLSRGGVGGRHNQRLISNVRSMFFTFRQLLWCYVLFGERLDQGQDPFLRETAQTLALGLNVLLGSPRTIWFWMNARHLRDRQQRRRGWRPETVPNRETWRQDLRESRAQASSLFDVSQRGMLSIAVEFLFGPASQPGPCEFAKWKMREIAIISLSSSCQSDGIKLTQFLPYLNDPPPLKSVRNDSFSTAEISECLQIVSHYNGVPVAAKGQQNNMDASFVFPELISEAVSGHVDNGVPTNGSERFLWDSFLFQDIDNGVKEDKRPPALRCLFEDCYVLTKLTKKEFLQCLFLNFFNFFGIVFMWSYIDKGGVLENAALIRALSYVFHVMKFYAGLFFAIPFFRAMIMLILNNRIIERNKRRQLFADDLDLDESKLIDSSRDPCNLIS